jgi:hypothetical protein
VLASQSILDLFNASLFPFAFFHRPLFRPLCVALKLCSSFPATSKPPSGTERKLPFANRLIDKPSDAIDLLIKERAKRAYYDVYDSLCIVVVQGRFAAISHRSACR